MKLLSKKAYYPEIDFIKMFAIISVILLHMLVYGKSQEVLYNTYASFYIWQAVPLFMLVFGFTFRLSIEKGRSLGNIVLSRIVRLLIPLFPAYILSFVLLNLFKITPEVSWHSLIGKLPLYGNGTYFIPLYVETIIYFIVLYYLVKKFNQYFVILFSIFFSVTGELIAYYINISDAFMYAASIHRYALFVVLGYYLYDHMNGKKDILTYILGAVSTILLIIYNIKMQPIWPYYLYDSAKSWGFQHFPYAYYTLIFSLFLIYLYKLIENKFIIKTITLIGQSSLHIFLTQIFIFNLRKFYELEINVLYGLAILLVTVCIGIAWYKFENFIIKMSLNTNLEQQR